MPCNRRHRLLASPTAGQMYRPPVHRTCVQTLMPGAEGSSPTTPTNYSFGLCHERQNVSIAHGRQRSPWPSTQLCLTLQPCKFRFLCLHVSFSMMLQCLVSLEPRYVMAFTSLAILSLTCMCEMYTARLGEMCTTCLVEHRMHLRNVHYTPVRTVHYVPG